jgi:molybdate transport system substrate-binding protein
VTRPGAPLRWASIAALTVVLGACSSTSSSEPGPGQRELFPTVFAASSLTDAFGGINQALAHQGSKATFSFAGSQALVAQIANGAPADVIATADATTMSTVASHLVAPAQVFARNRLVIVTARGNPHRVTSLSDLANPKLAVVLADPTVPAGKYAAQALAAAHVTVHPKSLELEVRSVLTKVELGEADAGIVYATDALAGEGKVTAVPLAGGPVASYEIGAVDNAGRAFVRFVLSAPGQSVLQHFGFLPP